jgi:hypothetical protein
MGRTERTEPGATTPEQKTHDVHRYLALGLGALAGLVFVLRGPSVDRDASEPPAAVLRAEPTRAELDAAIARLGAWVERSSRAPRTPLETNRRLMALGRGALQADSAAIATSLERLLLSRAESAAPTAALAGISPASSAVPSSAPDARGDASAAATLAILLEAGTPLAHELRLSSGSVRLLELLERALPEVLARPHDLDPWAIDLLSFAVLAGKTEPREALGSRVHASLLSLERAHRAPATGHGEHDDLAAVPALALAASVFRAIAVLSDDDLRERGLRCSNALIQRQAAERERWREQLERARGEQERLAIHSRAIETLGQLEQTLFGAHLAFRRGERAELPGRLATTIRRAAGDLLEHLSALERAGTFANEAARPDDMRAAARALRGLRAARIAL